METTSLSSAALSLLRRRLAAEWVGVTDENRPVYRELVEAGLMYPVHTLVNGREGYYRPTDAACDLRDAVNGDSPSIHSPSHAGSPAPGG
jgi:hypothetical protein